MIKRANLARGGFTLLDAIFGIFIIGIGIVTVIPLFNMAFSNLQAAAEKTHMVYLGEYVFESLKSERDSNDLIFKDLEEEGYVYYEDLEPEDLEKYICKLVDTGENDYLWNLKIMISSKHNRSLVSNVELRGSLPK